MQFTDAQEFVVLLQGWGCLGLYSSSTYSVQQQKVQCTAAVGAVVVWLLTCQQARTQKPTAGFFVGESWLVAYFWSTCSLMSAHKLVTQGLPRGSSHALISTVVTGNRPRGVQGPRGTCV
jgi:hypothetical protein